MNYVRCIGFLASLVLGSAAVADAAKPIETKKESQAEQGMRVYRDPVTGQLTSPPASVTRMEPQFQSDPSKVTTEYREDGTIIDHLNGQGQEAITASRDANGKLQFKCTDASESHARAAQKEQTNER